ncbi:hypothetical protein [Thalassotalea sp. ND16A]|uniref:hypothetical protein n=1 Tax=Thalassotalea sp. ND16A TaxID=1535422 RepID=UPI00051A42A2|nr:hypothetical protein [Thalassotalea sp. ND16A]KGJ88162.1 hypothetical protein ND16A_2715 [Thalassotalea sp. ND16A]
MIKKITTWDVFHHETLPGTTPKVTSHSYTITGSTLLHKFSDGSGVVLYQKNTGAATGLTLDIESVLARENIDADTLKLLNQLSASGFLTPSPAKY